MRTRTRTGGRASAPSRSESACELVAMIQGCSHRIHQSGPTMGAPRKPGTAAATDRSSGVCACGAACIVDRKACRGSTRSHSAHAIVLRRECECEESSPSQRTTARHPTRSNRRHLAFAPPRTSFDRLTEFPLPNRSHRPQERRRPRGDRQRFLSSGRRPQEAATSGGGRRIWVVIFKRRAGSSRIEVSDACGDGGVEISAWPLGMGGWAGTNGPHHLHMVPVLNGWV